MNPVMQEKVTEVIRQIDEQNSKSFNFGANMRLLNMKKMENWVKSRRQGLQQIETMNKAEIAEEIFKVWDRKLRRYIIFEDLAEHLITLGVAPDQHTVRKIMLALKGEDANFPDYSRSKSSSDSSELSRFGSAACEKIDQEFREENEEFVHQQYVRIIGASLQENEQLMGQSPKKDKTPTDPASCSLKTAAAR
eukprot:CAMPEP_0170465076 /NCGR_PEP_ID=MMETSP0123-20130129/9559_1 /TAXON_ID=182087 /ORGANISM="Favella ehrenbergii, Strain Fehren 1" /LENGTH=192 /DNA_ID=CAMNT_0010730889 /DNA_START=436 /DNA_END=1014 /DNA_ORIENTATION=-